MPRNKDVLWEHIIQDGRKVRCKFCQEDFVGGVTRMRYHLANTCSKDIRPCKAVPDSVRDIALQGVKELESKSKKLRNTRFPKSGNGSFGSILQSGDANIEPVQIYNPKPKSIHLSTSNSEKKEADKAIVKYIVSSNLSFGVLRNPEFREACIAIANAGAGYEPPSSAHTCQKLLLELKDEANVFVHSVRRLWEKSGCTLMLDSWTEGTDISYLHLFAASPKGIVYLKSLKIVEHSMDDQSIFEFVSSVIDDIGPQNVVQLITDNPDYQSIGLMIEEKYPNIFKINCATHCIALMLKELEALEYVSPILEGAKTIVNFTYKHQHSHTKTSDMKRPSTKFATNFAHLRSLLKQEHALRHIVGTKEWKDFTGEGMEVQKMIKDAVFWGSVKELIHAIEPLLKTMRLVDHGGSTSGYIYDAIRKAKKAAREFCRGDAKYLSFQKVIDDNWSNILCNDIHAAAAYLNPHLFHDGHVRLDSQVKSGLEKVIQRMVSDNEERLKVVEELRDYHSLDPRIFGLMAVDSLHVSHPRIWWDMWGGSVPILQSLAIKVLSQPCSFLTCEKRWSGVEVTPAKKRDILDTTRLHDLLYVRMNTHLMNATPKSEKFDLKPIDADKLEAFPDELEEVDLHGHGDDSDDKEEDEVNEACDEARRTQ